MKKLLTLALVAVLVPRLGISQANGNAKKQAEELAEERARPKCQPPQKPVPAPTGRGGVVPKLYPPDARQPAMERPQPQATPKSESAQAGRSQAEMKAKAEARARVAQAEKAKADAVASGYGEALFDRPRRTAAPRPSEPAPQGRSGMVKEVPKTSPPSRTKRP